MKPTAVLGILLLTIFAGAGRTFANDSGQPKSAPYREGVVLLAFRNGTQPAVQKAILSSVGAREIKRIGVGVQVVAVKPGQVFAAIDSLKAFQAVRYAEPDYLQSLSAGSLPNDTYVGVQWAVQNTGQTANGTSGTPGADERSLAAWSVTTGTNSVVIAELDTGVQYSHPDLITNMWNNPGGVGGCSAGTHGYNVLSSNCDPMDDDTAYGGHGTHVAGIIGAIGNNAAGTVGVNWTTSIMAVKWVNSSGSGATSDLITGMDWVVSAKQAGVNVRVANDSQTWPGTAVSQALSDEIDLLGSNDILFVTASGNTAQNNDVVPRYPCSYERPTMICVAASDPNDNLWSSANYGPKSDQLAAPGVNIYSTLRVSNYGYISGGSMASPQVAGTAALILSLGYQSVANLRTMILNNVDVLSSLSGLVGTSGRLNVCKAVPGCSTAVAGTPANSIPPVVTSIPVQGGLLGASTGAWTGVPSTYTYQWSRCDQNGLNCAPIPGATGQTYALLAPADALDKISVTVTASNTFGSGAAQSSASSAVATATSSSAIASSIVSGATLSGSASWTVTPSRSEQFVQFYIDGVLAETDSSSPYAFTTGASGSLDTTTLSNGPHILGARALYTDNRTYDFYGETVTVSNPPQNTSLPAISGTILSGQTLSTTNGVWNPNAPPVSFAYQWEHCDSKGSNCAAIAGATASSYTLSAADANFTIRSSVTGSNSAGPATAISNQTTVVPSNSLSISATSLPNGTQNAPYSATFAATGGATPYAWSISSGALPAGLVLASSTGAISGTPTGAGTNNFTVRVTDANSLTATQSLSLTINGPSGGSGIGLVQANALQGSSVKSLSVAFSATNVAGDMIVAFVRMSSTTQTVTVTDSAGNSYVKAASQVQTSDGSQIFLFYSPNIIGAANTVKATFSSSNSHAWLAIYEYKGLSASNPLDQTTHAQGRSAAPNSGATPTTTSANELVFAAFGLPSTYKGTQTAGSGFILIQNNTGTAPAATESMQVTSTSSYAGSLSLNSTANWSAIVATFAAGAPGGPVVTTASLPNGTQNASYSATLAASGGTSPYSWSIVSGTLPAGLTLASSTGVISGTPTGTGTSNFTVQALDANSLTAAMPLSLTVAVPPTVTTTSLPNGTQNAAYSATLAATGGTAPYTWSIVSGTLPAGLTLASGTGVISGTPTGAGTSNFTVQVSDANSLTAAIPLSLSIGASPPAITTASLPNGTQNAAYNATLAATGGTVPYSWSIVSGTLPAGLTLASGTGVISGTPTGAGTSNFTVQVSDFNSLTATKPLSLTTSSSAGGGIGLVQMNAVQGSGVGSVSIAFPTANAGGNLILAFVRMSSTSQTVTLTDTAGNAYIQAVGQVQTADGAQAYLYYAKNIAGAAANTVTATFSSANNHPWLAIYEYKGLNTTNPLDQTAHAQGSNSAPNSGATPATTSANELVFTATGLPASYAGTQTAGSGYTFLEQDTGTSPAANASMLATATGSYTATFTLSGTANWAALVATFKQ